MTVAAMVEGRASATAFCSSIDWPGAQRRRRGRQRDHTYAFAARVGGGIDIPLKSRFQIRAIQVDWFRTQSANAKNDRQNNLLVAAGITYHWSIAK